MNRKIEPRPHRYKIIKRKIVSVISVVVIVYVVFWAGYITGTKNSLSFDNGQRIVNLESGKPKDVNFSLYWEAWNKLREKTVLNADANKMVNGSISGMVASLGDPYTSFFTPDENKRFHEDIAGEFSGIGVEIDQKNYLPTVVSPLSGSPAEKAGIKAGDIITEVDGAKTSDIGFEETINRIRGENGKAVKLKVVREGSSNAIEISIVRDSIVVKSVEWSYKTSEGKKILYVKIRQFGNDTDQLFSEAVDDALKTKPDAILIDLRNNPGGYLVTSVDLASYFLDGGVVVSEKGKENKEYKTTGPAKLKDYKVAVLVNKGSASASEIFSGALQDRGIGKLIGEKTFGKGSVQELIDLSNGSALKVTVAKWYTPNGRQISDQGINPDIAIVNDDKSSTDAQYDRAAEYLTKNQ